MEKKIIAVLFGGVSAEYSISLQSAHAVITHIDTEKYLPLPVGITRQGHWYRYRGPAQNILQDTWCNPADCTPAFISPCRSYAGLVEYGKEITTITKLDAAFPVMHGTNGEDGTLQGLLELAGIPIIGCGTLASALCMDKDIAHALVESIGIPVPKSRRFTSHTPLDEIKKTAAALGYPLFVKPVGAGSSFGIARVMAPADLPSAVEQAFRFDTQILLEEAIDGCEVGCAVLGDEKALTMGKPDEIELADGFFDFTEKYNLLTSKIHVPARLPKEKIAQIKQAAAAIYKQLRCRGFARVDLFASSDGRLVFNEVNTIPGFTAHSRYPMMMKAAGIPFANVINTLIERAVAS